MRGGFRFPNPIESSFALKTETPSCIRRAKLQKKPGANHFFQLV